MSTTPASVALITGGASGIGFAIARKLLSQGSTVALIDLGAERLKSAARQLDGDVLTFEADITSEDSIPIRSRCPSVTALIVGYTAYSRGSGSLLQ